MLLVRKGINSFKWGNTHPRHGLAPGVPVSPCAGVHSGAVLTAHLFQSSVLHTGQQHLPFPTALMSPVIPQLSGFSVLWKAKSAVSGITDLS